MSDILTYSVIIYNTDNATAYSFGENLESDIYNGVSLIINAPIQIVLILIQGRPNLHDRALDYNRNELSDIRFRKIVLNRNPLTIDRNNLWEGVLDAVWDYKKYNDHAL